MLASRRWRDWRPPENGVKYREQEPPKPPKPILSVLSVPALAVSEIDAAPRDIPPHEPDAWREDFIRWAQERCALREDREDSAGIACLLVDFAEWCLAHDAVPLPEHARATFEELLKDSGFPIQDGMALGLILKSDLEAVLCSLIAPEGSEAPALAGKRANSKRRRP